MLTEKVTTPSYKAAAKSAEDELWDMHLEEPLPILIRASDGKDKEARKEDRKTRLSTVVQPDGIEAFYTRYAEVCKVGMSGLKKRDRTKRKKDKAKKKKAAADADKKA